MKKRIGIYLHIPFCLQKCRYCDFVSYSGILARQDEYTAALCKEISMFPDGYLADTLYFGGGTPTLLRIENIAAVLRCLKDKFLFTSDCEITMECNPETANKEKLCQLQRLGINRLSVGMQSADNQTLKTLGRIHTFEETVDCFRAAREAGFQNLSLDLMYGLPGQSVSDWRLTLEQAIALHPEHFSCYALKIEEGTPLAEMSLVFPDDDTVREMYDLGVEMLEKAGYPRYEISNFAPRAFVSRHNLKYWECLDFAGFGAGAYGCIHGARFANTADFDAYIRDSATENRLSYKETLSQEDRMSEFMFLGLRTAEGVNLEEFFERFGVLAESVFKKPFKKYLSTGVLVKEKQHVFLRKDLFFVCNGILADFLL